MSVNAIVDDYKFEAADLEKNFHGNRLVYVGWDHHLFFCAPICFPLPPDMPFGALVQEVIPSVFGVHPDFDKIDWDKVEWQLDGEAFSPQMDASLDSQGIGHKSVLRMETPGLHGLGDGLAG